MYPEFLVISTGNEIISGNSQDTNSSWIAQNLFALGFSVKAFYTYPDDPAILVSELSQLSSGTEKIAVMTGGLGPTEDDYTLHAVLSILNGKKKRIDSAFNKLEERYLSGLITKESFELAARQTSIPEHAIEVENTAGIAPGFIVEINKLTLVCLPGVPYEMQEMFSSTVMPYLSKKIYAKALHYASRFLWHMNETDFQLDFIQKNEDLLQNGISWGVAPKKGYLKVSFQSEDNELLNTIISRLQDFYQDKCTTDVFTEVPVLLKKFNIKIATAESCTGGLIAKMLTDVAGSSVYFLGSVVAYHNSIKMKILKVKESTISVHGAVSQETAMEMTTGLEAIYNSDISVSVTGIAGPDGGSSEKPVGLVFIGIKLIGKPTQILEFHFRGDRQKIRELTANTVYFNLYKILLCI